MEEAGEEEEEEAGGGASNVLPDFVISLEATDDFVCERVMSLPEKQIQVNHLVEFERNPKQSDLFS